MGIYPVEERIQALRDLLGIPGHVIPLCMVSIGYPAEKKGLRPDLGRNSCIKENGSGIEALEPVWRFQFIEPKFQGNDPFR